MSESTQHVARLAATFRHSPVGIAVTRLHDNTLLDVNTAWLQLLGYTYEAVIGRTALDLEVWAEPEERQRLIALLRTHQRVTNVEANLNHSSGRRIHVLISAEQTLLNDELCMLFQIIDITERKQAEAALQASEAHYRLLFDTMAQGVVYQAADGSIIDANPAAQTILGLTLDQMQGRTSSDPCWNTVHEDGTPFPGDTHPAMVALRTGQPVRDVVMGIASTTSQERRWISVNATPIFHPGESRPYQVYTTFSDITGRKEAEEAHRRSEAELRTVVECTPDTIFIVDRQLRIEFINRIPPGVSVESPLGDSVLTYVLPEHRDLVKQAIQGVFDSGQPTSYEAQARGPDPDDRTSWYYTRLAPLRTGGETTRVLLIAQDITQAREAQERVRRSEEQYRSLMESLDSGVATFDAEGRVLYLNDVAAHQLGGTPHKLIGKTMHDLFPVWVAREQLAAIQTAIREDRRITQEVLSPVQGGPRWQRITIQPIHDEAGRAISALVNASDIHDLKLAQQELLELNRTLEERVRQRTAEVQDLYEHAPAGYHSLDTNGTIIRMNQTELSWLGYAYDELIGRPFTDVLSQASRALFETSFPIFKQLGWVRDLELELVRKDGSSFPILISATAIYDKAGSYVMSRSTVFDLTERKAADAALQHANAELARAARAKDEFLANMSHELRTPLNAVLGFSESLLEEVQGPLNARQQTALRYIEASGRHLLTLINDILDISKVEAGKLIVEPEPILVADVCQSSMLLVRESAVRKALTLALRLHNDLSEIEADPRRLKQMLVNLLSNAVKFTPERGTVSLTVRADPQAGVVQFAVEDTGIGIAPEDLTRLFQPFVQLDSRLSRQHEGSGLGLALVRRLAELHGGSISVESTVGVGSRFTITLPYTPPLPARQT